MLLKFLIIAVLILTGAIFMYKTLKVRIISKTAKQWPIAKGNLTSCEIKEDILRSSTGSIVNVYYVEIAYDYLVKGNPYTGNRITFGSPHYDYQSASLISERFAVGKEVDVHYDQNNPAESVLVPYSKHAMRSMVPGIFFLAVGIVSLVIMLIYGL